MYKVDEGRSADWAHLLNSNLRICSVLILMFLIAASDRNGVHKDDQRQMYVRCLN